MKQRSMIPKAKATTLIMLLTTPLVPCPLRIEVAVAFSARIGVKDEPPEAKFNW